MVKLYELPDSDFLAGARAEENRVEIVARNGEVVRLAGKGAGRWPTALSVLGDVHEYLRERRAALGLAGAGIGGRVARMLPS